MNTSQYSTDSESSSDSESDEANRLNKDSLENRKAREAVNCVMGEGL